MYARYIPPAKSAQSTNQTTSTTPSQPLNQPISRPSEDAYRRPFGRGSAAATPSTAAELPQPTRIVFGDDEDFPLPVPKKGRLDPDAELTGTPDKEQRKSKKSKSKKSRKQETEQQVEEPSTSRRGEEVEEVQNEEAGAPELEMPVDGTASTSLEEEPQAQAERKKPKREKKKKQPKGEAEPESDKVRARHKAVFEKVEKALQSRPNILPEAQPEPEPEPEIEEHGLEPLPQPEPVVPNASKLTYETTANWLSSPIRVPADSRRPFSELGITPESAKILASKGFADAFAIQTAVLPLLLPSADRQGDVVVAAPTGSGKTLSYVLPMVHDVSKSRVTRLRALIVLPTRELVQQVQQAFEACAAAFAIGQGKRVKIGTAVGNKPFKAEQSAIIGTEQRYDPAGYMAYMTKQRQFASLDDDDDLELGSEKTEPLPYHVVDYISKVDILICTPGRLVEHVTKTRGFTLDYVRWLVVDEADKLLAQDFQQWLDVVLKGLSTEIFTARDFPGSNKTGPRKVILSATMTGDMSLLNGLQQDFKLSRPRLVLLEGAKAGEQTLPALLKESAIKIREPSLKPLYLLELLNDSSLLGAVSQAETAAQDKMSIDSDSDSHSGSESSGSDSESSGSDSESSGSDSESSGSDSASEAEGKRLAKSPSAKARSQKFNTTVLIFTKSNEAALRLSRLLEILSPDLAPLVGTLTSSTKTSKRRATLRSFSSGKLRILVASDLVSRGIDLLNLDHVINYDLPISETSYVHRVGRTARAGRTGHAWTLLEHSEGRRFWHDFVGEKGATSIVRSGTVERVRLKGGEFSEERVKAYEEALEQLGKEAAERK